MADGNGYYITSSPDAHSPNTVFPSYANVLDSTTSEMYIARTYLAGMLLGLQRVSWFARGAVNFAIVDDGGKTLKPATSAYSSVADWLVNCTFISSTKQDDGTWIVEMSSPRQTEKHIIWNENDNVGQFTIPAAWQASTAIDISGNTHLITSGPISVSGVPILLE